MPYNQTSIIPKNDENMDDSNRGDDVMVRDTMVPPRQGQLPSLGFASRELLGYLTIARHACETAPTQFQQHCQDTGIDMPNQELHQFEWRLWARQHFDPDTCPYLQGIIDQGRRQLAASYSWQYSPSQDVSGHFDNAVRLLDVSCQALIWMIPLGMNDWDVFTKLQLELRAAVSYANLSKEVDPGHFWS